LDTLGAPFFPWPKDDELQETDVYGDFYHEADLVIPSGWQYPNKMIRKYGKLMQVDLVPSV
jgi:hypothetical protein